MQIPFVGPTYNLDDRPASVQRSINLMPLPAEPGNERAGWVFSDVAGLSAFSSDASVNGVVTVAGGSGSNGSSTSLPATFTTNIRIGDVVIHLCYYRGDDNNFTPTCPGYTVVTGFAMTPTGVTQLRIFARVCDGTAIDRNVPTPYSSPDAWLFYASALVRNVPLIEGTIVFPNYLVDDLCIVGGGSVSSPPSATPSFASPRWVDMVVGAMSSTVPAIPPAFTAPPSGYTQIALNSVDWITPASHHSTVLFAWQDSSAISATPGAFGVSQSGEQHAVTLRIPYSPT